ncbi:MAG TPA: hypothetical protein VGN72_12045 [Tepidisphaeraceae bacterium]|jgi:hypothetical protein|nr:hypothetical protein [Tepidisphaeraceae bacterium]
MRPSFVLSSSSAIAFVLPLLVALIAPTFGQAAPATRPTAEIADDYKELAATDPAARNAARVRLMGMSRLDLVTLRDVVTTHLPVAPAQAVALHDVVRHVYLASETVESNGNQGFLGVAPTRYGRGAAFVVDPDGPVDVRVGADFQSRTPGFCAYRWLQDGDVILSMGTDEMLPITSFSILSEYVRRTPAGTTIRMRVLRGGGVVVLEFPLDARPAALDFGADLSSFMNERSRRAEAYWQQVFAPLIEPDHT